jgi:predicted O-methyltransferase YrrM
MLDRKLVLQTLIDKNNFENYLEIGVFTGVVFFSIAAKSKTAVDPMFRFSKTKRLMQGLRSISNLTANYIEKTSDDFFSQDSDRLFKYQKIDIALIDGMHVYYVALRDIENTLLHLQPNGVIVVHDCNPQSAQAAESFDDLKRRNFEGVWNGDVWKAIVHLRSIRNDIHVFTLDCDHGLGIVIKGKPENMLSFTQVEIDEMTYNDFAVNKKEFLNLKPWEYFYEYFGLKLDKIQH